MPIADPELRKVKQREYQAKWYANTANHRKQNASVHRCGKISRKALRDEVNALKRAPCMDCGQQYDVEAMDFDHRPGETKLGTVSSMITRGRRKTMEEIAKCDLVCAGCHRVRTKARRLGHSVVMI